jgi:hypothetical protein
LFILYVICEHGEAWWNDIDRGGAWFVLQSSLAVLPAESYSSKAGGTWRGKWISRSNYLFSYIKVILNVLKCWHGASGFVPFRRKACYGMTTNIEAAGIIPLRRTDSCTSPGFAVR